MNIELLSPALLTVYPPVKKLPPISDDEKLTLLESIRAHGVLEPLVCTPDHEVYMGRARLEIAVGLKLGEIPCVIRPSENALIEAIDSRLVRGQLTKNGMALFLYNERRHLADHPCRGGRPSSRDSRQKIPAGLPPVSNEVADNESFRELARYYRLDRDIFTLLKEADSALTKAQWQELERRVFILQVPIGRAYAGICGGAGMSKKGRSETQYFPGWDNDDAWSDSPFCSSLVTVRNALSRYDKSDKWVKRRVEKEVVALWGDLPKEIRDACLGRKP